MDMFVDDKINFDIFQREVKDILIRNSSILDITTKLSEYSSRINRAVMKSATNCGCIEIHGRKQDYNYDSFEELRNSMDGQVIGKLCPMCKDILEDEIGSFLFYLAALCNVLDIDMKDPIIKEYNKMKTLGIFNLK